MTLSAEPGPRVGMVSPLHPTLNYAGKAALAPTIVLLDLFSLFLYRSAGLQTLAFVCCLFFSILSVYLFLIPERCWYINLGEGSRNLTGDLCLNFLSLIFFLSPPRICIKQLLHVSFIHTYFSGRDSALRWRCHLQNNKVPVVVKRAPPLFPQEVIPSKL